VEYSGIGMTVVRLADYRHRDLTSRYDGAIADATYILEASMLLVLTAIETQLKLLAAFSDTQKPSDR